MGRASQLLLTYDFLTFTSGTSKETCKSLPFGSSTVLLGGAGRCIAFRQSQGSCFPLSAKVR